MDKIKVCVFCNKYPISKNKEHVIPDWLIKITGVRNRPASITGVSTGPKIISFKSFTFPACKQCNSLFSGLEGEAKLVVLKLINRSPLSSSEIELLMDWLDKVRIGLWLGSIMYSKNPLGIIPHYGISSRPKKDRLLIISTTKEPSIRLTFSGFNDPLFHQIPCFFGIYINGVSLISISADCLLTGELPLPNFNKIAEAKEGKIVALFEYPKKISVSLPYIGKRFILLAQVNYSQLVEKKYFNDKQLQFINDDLSSSKVLIIKKNKMYTYPKESSRAWILEEHSTRDYLFKEQNHKFIRLRNWIAIKSFKYSPNPLFTSTYQKLLKAKIISENY